MGLSKTQLSLKLVLGCLLIGAQLGRAQSIERVSVSTVGDQANRGSEGGGVSGDGRFVVLSSEASNLVLDDTNGLFDVFVRDRVLNTTERVSVSGDGREANGDSTGYSISRDGRFVVFTSNASNLVPDDDGALDVFVRDRLQGTTAKVSSSMDGGRSNGESTDGSISADGRFVVFVSSASNLVPNDPFFTDVFIRELSSGLTEKATGDFSDCAQPALSEDGRFVAFVCGFPSLVFLHDRATRQGEIISLDQDGMLARGSLAPSVSRDGRFVAFRSESLNLVSGDLNGLDDVFVRDRQTGTNELISVAVDGQQTDNASNFAEISSDGRFVVFQSFATNLTAEGASGLGDLYVRDREQGTTKSVSTEAGRRGNGDSGTGFRTFGINGDATAVGFASNASNLIENDTNFAKDAFVRFLPPPTPVRIDLNVAIRDAGPLNPRSQRPIDVAIFGAVGVDVAEIALDSLAFGPAHAPISGRSRIADLDGDGSLDLLVEVRARESGIRLNDTEICVVGRTLAGQELMGCTPIRTVEH